MPVLTPTIPAWMASAARQVRPKCGRQIRGQPNSVALAKAMASASSVKTQQRCRPGQKFPHAQCACRVSRPPTRVRLVERAAERMPLATGQYTRALLYGIGHQGFCLFSAGGSINGPECAPSSVPWPTRSACTASHHLAAKPSYTQIAPASGWRGTSLARVAVFGGHCALYRHVQVGMVGRQ